MDATTTPDATMSRNEATMRRFYTDVFMRRRFELLPDLVSPDICNHTAPEGRKHGYEPVLALIEMLDTAFPDASYDVDDVVTGGDVAVMRTWYQGTHLGEFLGHPATGRTFRFLQ